MEAHLRKLRMRDSVSAAEEDAIRELVSEVRTFSAHKTVIHEGVELNVSLLLLDGWLARAKDVKRGNRQILELHVPGDFADLHSFTLKALDHDVIALTPVRLGVVPHDRLTRLTERFPRLTRLYWLMTNVDASIQRELTLSLGSRSAMSRAAHLFCELFERLRVGGLADDDGYALPLTQAQLSECLGITPVHVNRTLQALRADGLITLEQRYLTIHDHARLREIGEFDPRYLYLRQKPS
ncbi:Crp/Fnr family transcriptional regulator [Sphingomonas lutea]|uniref:Crp/Fnr family transcriptional regulator n=1 Tax=Sphingomonas lutea TaxID=1045317 RepID=A0A7G9SGH3_9SPHN|nr:Crp/Fnr family transcriptional regulator [Sphingomonas lutea]QNN66948.1 Crp/Fnr family transcriptional regulator [Sphingomonas lutea]